MSMHTQFMLTSGGGLVVFSGTLVSDVLSVRSSVACEVKNMSGLSDADFEIPKSSSRKSRDLLLTSVCLYAN